METPLFVLQEKLDRLLSARKHSLDSFKERKINSDNHEMHINNLTPQIEDYKFAIKMLKKYT